MRTPQRPRHPEPERLGSIVVRARVRRIVIVDIKVVKKAPASLGRRSLHLGEEPREEVLVAVCGVVRVADAARPVCRTTDTHTQ